MSFLILLRHGDKKHGEDPQLSDRGALQAQTLIEAAQAWPERPGQIFSSPKKRALQTVAPLAKLLHLQVHVHSQFDERGFDETRLSFEARLQMSAEGLQKLAKTTLVVSHFDWIQEVLLQLPTTLTEPAPFATGEWLILKHQQGGVFDTIKQGRL